MTTKVLLAAGCSYTDANFYSKPYNTSTIMWPELLSQELGMKVINTGLTGSCNRTIINRAIDQIIESKPEITCVLLTSWDRFTLGNEIWTPWSYISYLLGIFKSNHIDNGNIKAVTKAKIIKDMLPFMNAREMVKETNKYIKRLEYICKINGSQLILKQGLKPWTHDWNMQNATAFQFKDEYPQFFVDDEKILSLIENTEWLDQYLGNDQRLGPEDGHPNQSGQIYLKERFRECIDLSVI